MAKVLLIAGHGRNYNGSYDPGACSKFGQEADYTRELARMVQQAIGNAVPVVLYDTNKNCYSYSKAGQTPNYGAYGVVAEIHFNAKSQKDEAGDGKFTGIGGYVAPGNGGRTVLENIVNEVVGMGFKKWQVAEQTGLLNLNNAQKAGVKYFLLETAFIDDKDDMDWYNGHKQGVAQAVAKEIIKAAGGSVAAASPSQSAQTAQGVEKWYRVGTGWRNGKCQNQTGAYKNLDYAIKACKTGQNVYDWDGNIVHKGTASAPVSAPQVSYYPRYAGSSGSIAEALKAVGANGSYASREVIAKKNGIAGYTGTADQNIKMLALLKQGKLIK